MRRIVVVVSTMALTLLVAGGVALAANIQCVVGTRCVGTLMADTMSGTDLRDFMVGRRGNDTMHGYGDGDHMRGDQGSDHIYGDAGPDEYLSGGARSSGVADTSDDYVRGGSGADYIVVGYAHGGVDRLYGGDQNDVIDAYEPGEVTKEIIDCGSGASDEVDFDKGLDVTTNCEIKHGVSSGGGGGGY